VWGDPSVVSFQFSGIRRSGQVQLAWEAVRVGDPVYLFVNIYASFRGWTMMLIK
jgi:hypothetical protein